MPKAVEQAVNDLANGVGNVLQEAAPVIGAVVGFYMGGVNGAIIGYNLGNYAKKSLSGDSGQSSSSGFSAQASGRDQVVRSGTANRTIIYGRSVVSGPLVFAAVAGTGNNTLYLVIPLAGHEIDGIEKFWLNDVPVDASISDGGSFSVPSGVYAGKVTVALHAGTSGQSADGTLLNAGVGWTSAHRLAGVAYVVVTLTYDKDAFPTGIPNFKFQVRGKKLYDPRTGLTTWSANTALAVRDYITSSYGLEAAAGELDDTLIIAAANVCDESVAIVGGSEARYTCNGVLDTGDTPRSNMEALLSSMAGFVVWSGGKYLVYPGAYSAPAVTLTADDLRGPVRVRPRISRRDLYNAVRGTYVSPDAFWQPTDFPTVSNATYAANDGNQVIWRDMALPFTTSSPTAQRIAKLMLERSRQGITVEMQAKLTAFKVATLDTVMVTISQLGWSAKEFKVLEWKFAPEGGVDLVLQEETAASYNWNSGLQTVVDPAADTNLGNPWSVATPGTLTLASGTSELIKQLDGTVVSRIKASWAPPSDVFTEFAELQYKLASSADWLVAPRVQASQGAVWFTPVQDGALYNARIRFTNTIGVRSAWVNASNHTVIGKTEPPATVASLNLNGKVLTWPAVADIDLNGYRIKFQYGTNLDWGTATQMHVGLVTDSPYTFTALPPGTITIMVRAVDTTGNESLDSAYVVVNLGNSLVANVLETNDYKALNWPGTLTNATLSGGNIAATQTDPFYLADAAYFYGSDTSAFYSSNYDGLTWVSAGYTPSLAATGSNMTLAWTITGNNYSVQYRKTGPLPFYGDDADYFYGVDADAFYSPAGAWTTWPGSMSSDNQEYQFQVTTTAGTTAGLVSAFTVSVDVPDKTQKLSNVSLLAAGSRLTGAIGQFNVIQNIQLTLQGGSTAVSLEITDKSASLGPLIIAKNSAGSGVAATVDAFLQGY